MMKLLLLAAIVLNENAAAFVAPSAVARQSLFARPPDCPEDVWTAVVEAERKSREKKIGPLGTALGALDARSIEANQLRIWEEVRKRRDDSSNNKKQRKKKNTASSPPSPPEKEKEEGPFASLRNAWNKMYAEADAMGYAQALSLSADLENRGLLPKVVTANATAEAADETPVPRSRRRDAAKKKKKKSSSRKKKGRSPSPPKGFGS
mmetsp:Transcript_430/g.1212  ORF Transcript_430/g.1212 Transcript_430/m.1212 type:complete len:207 (-) Transcript_430:41-661(-)